MKKLWVALPLLALLAACSPMALSGAPVATALPVFTLTPKSVNTPTPYLHLAELEPPQVLTVTADVLNVRACPSTGCESTGRYLYHGEQVRGYCRVDGWCQIGTLEDPAWIWGGCAGLENRSCE